LFPRRPTHAARSQLISGPENASALHTQGANYVFHSSFTVTTKSYLLTINENFPTAAGMQFIVTQFAFTVTLI
jgi:hypothetical protein